MAFPLPVSNSLYFNITRKRSSNNNKKNTENWKLRTYSQQPTGKWMNCIIIWISPGITTAKLLLPVFLDNLGLFQYKLPFLVFLSFFIGSLVFPTQNLVAIRTRNISNCMKTSHELPILFLSHNYVHCMRKQKRPTIPSLYIYIHYMIIITKIPSVNWINNWIQWQLRRFCVSVIKRFLNAPSYPFTFPESNW